MILCMCFTIENWLTIISLLFAVAGGIFALCQWKSSIKIKRAEFINQINDRIRFDKEFAETLYIIEYGTDWYDKGFHSDKEKEFKFDKVLSYLDYICYLKSTKNITRQEFKVFQYRINRVCISNSTQFYLWNLFHFAKKNNSGCSFQCLLDYGIRNRFIRDEIQTNNNLFPQHKHLNF